MFKKTRILIESLRSKWFPTEEDKIWGQWVDYAHRGTEDLVKLLSSNVRDSFKRRAIFLLLVPSADLNPVYWKDEVGKFYQNLDFLKTLTPNLLDYATELIVEFYELLRPSHRDKPKNIAGGGGGIVVFMQIPDKYHTALCFYNNCILRLLALLPMERGEKIFSLFSLRDISTFSDMEDSSGYNPFQNLLYSEVDETWKRRSDATMRQIIQNELTGKTQPREKWENALICYAEVIKLQTCGDGLDYSVGLFADQIQFLVSEEHFGSELLSSWEVPRIYKILSADIYKEIRYRVVKFLIFGNNREFSVLSDDTLIFAERILEEFGEDDQNLALKIQTSIDAGKEILAERQKEQSVIKQSEDDILNQMK